MQMEPYRQQALPHLQLFTAQRPHLGLSSTGQKALFSKLSSAATTSSRLTDMTDYFSRHSGQFTLAADASYNVRFVLAFHGEDEKKVLAKYRQENPITGNQANETALIVIYGDLAPRPDLMSDAPVAAQPTLLPDGLQRGEKPKRPKIKRRKYTKRVKSFAAITPSTEGSQL
jgi:hypothetical protein